MSVADAGFLAAPPKDLGQHQLVKLFLIVPVIQTSIVGQNQIHVCSIFRVQIDPGLVFAERMSDTARLRNRILCIIEIRKDHDEKGHVVAERHLSGKSVFSL